MFSSYPHISYDHQFNSHSVPCDRASRPNWQQQDCSDEGGACTVKTRWVWWMNANSKKICKYLNVVNKESLTWLHVYVCVHFCVHVYLIFVCLCTWTGADYGQISEETWQYLLGVYGGGPEIAVRQSVSSPESDTHGERKIEAETRALWASTCQHGRFI